VKRFGEFFKSALIGGFFVILPIALLIFLLQEAFDSLAAIMAPIVDVIPIEEIAGVKFATAFGIAVLLVLCFLAGAATRTTPGRRLSGWFDEKVLGRIPAYGVLKTLTQQIAGQDAEGKFTPAVAILTEDIHDLAYIVEEHDDEFVTVLLPNAPMGMTGQIRFLKKKNVRKIDASFTDVLDSMTFWGEGSAKLFRS